MSDTVKYTTDYNLIKYPSGHLQWGDGVNGNFDIIDSALADHAAALAALEVEQVGTVFEHVAWTVRGALSAGDVSGWVPLLRASVPILVGAAVKTPSTLNAIDIDILWGDGTSWTSLLTTNITIDINEYASWEAATPAVLIGDSIPSQTLLRINVDDEGTNAEDLVVTFLLSRPIGGA